MTMPLPDDPAFFDPLSRPDLTPPPSRVQRIIRRLAAFVKRGKR